VRLSRDQKLLRSLCGFPAGMLPVTRGYLVLRSKAH